MSLPPKHRRRGSRVLRAVLGVAVVATVGAWAWGGMAGLHGVPRGDRAAGAPPSASPGAAGKIPEFIADSPWIAEPRVLRQPRLDLTAGLDPFPTSERRPEPIPLPPAAVVGPVFLTALIAGAMMKKRQPGRRRGR